MPAIGSIPNGSTVRSQLVSGHEDQSRDWELVLQESHHRMKNTLTLLGASVRRDFTRAGSRDLSGAVDRFERRICAFGRLYQLLSSSDEPSVSVATFFENLCEALSAAVLEPAGVRCEALIEGGVLPASQCHRLALMITELVTNAAKHAFPEQDWSIDPDRGRLPRRHMDLRGGRQRHWCDASAPRRRQPYPGRACAQHSRAPARRSGGGRHSDLHRNAGYRLKIDGSHAAP